MLESAHVQLPVLTTNMSEAQRKQSEDLSKPTDEVRLQLCSVVPSCLLNADDSLSNSQLLPVAESLAEVQLGSDNDTLHKG